MKSVLSVSSVRVDRIMFGNAKMHADLAIFSNRVLQHRARTYRRVRQAGRPLQQ